jgi:hypothetical protein
LGGIAVHGPAQQGGGIASPMAAEAEVELEDI